MYATRLATLRFAFVGAGGEPTACDAVARNVIVAGNARVACAIAALDSAFVFDGVDLIPARSSAKTGAVPANTTLVAAMSATDVCFRCRVDSRFMVNLASMSLPDRNCEIDARLGSACGRGGV